MATYDFSSSPPKEVTNYLKNKGMRPAFSWEEVWKEEHAMAFTVAKAVEMDVLQSIRDELQKNLSNGMTFRDFKKNLEPTLQKLGWWGQKQMKDPLTDKVKLVQLGSPRRLKTIYDTNMRAARAAGQWERIQRTKDALPYLIYEMGPSREHRKEHLQFKGLIRPVDDPIWGRIMPPNGFGCKCRVRQISLQEAVKLGGVSQEIRLEEQEYVNKRTGEVTQGIRGVGPGFDYNPGMTRMENLDNFLAGKFEGISQEQARIALADLVGSSRFGNIYNGKDKGFMPVGVLPAVRTAQLGVSTQVVRFSDYTADKGMRKHSEIKQEDYKIVQWLMENGEVTNERENHLVFVGQKDGKYWQAIVKKTKDGKELYLQSLYMVSQKLRKKKK